ncbi:MAG: hypothetical protein ACFFCQ_00710 [Promethearchaeota archaeon]
MSELVTLAKIVPFSKDMPLNIPQEFIDAIEWKEPEKYGLLVATGNTQLVRVIPIKTDYVLKITAQLDEITPEMIQNIGSLFRQFSITSLYSTGLCIQKEACFYELYADPETLTGDLEQLRVQLMELEAINDVSFEKISL